MKQKYLYRACSADEVYNLLYNKIIKPLDWTQENESLDFEDEQSPVKFLKSSKLYGISLSKSKEFAFELLDDESPFMVTYNYKTIMLQGGFEINYKWDYLVKHPAILAHILGGEYNSKSIMEFMKDDGHIENQESYHSSNSGYFQNENTRIVKYNVEMYEHEQEVLIKSIFF
ncbi:hypothetical protein EZS27_013088 [termite gut metagenome]|uniref:Uncharacterized protein n=1 Tax=termite gut metagenome TaxID=433724 RepID=A0A5J4RYF7_9ZZZZ